MVSPYYYGQYRWDNYIHDVQRNQEAGNDLQEQNVRLNHKMIDAAGQQFGELREQTRELRNISETLQLGFEEMRAEFNWGFTLMVEHLDQQIDLLSQIAARLDAIHKTLQSPLMTQARELFLIGQDRFKKGLWDKALEAFLMAEQKNDVDFPLQFQIGKLYLYGNNGDLSLVDVTKADKHFSFAVRVAEAEKDSLPNWSRNCGEAHFHAAVAAYLFGEQEQESGANDGRRQCLERALGHLAKAISLWPKFTESIYLQAKCQSLLGRQKPAIDALAFLSDRDRRYYAKASRDHDFDLVRPSVDEVFRKTLVEPGRLAKSAQDLLGKAFGALEWARRSKPDQSGDSQTINSIAKSLEKGRAVLGTLNVDIEGLHEETTVALRNLDETTQRILGGRVDAVRAQLQQVESRRATAQGRAEHLRDGMKKTEGSKGWGCFSSVVVYFGLCYFISVALTLPLVRDLVSSFVGRHSMIFYLGIFALAIVGYGVGVQISQWNKNKPKRQEVEENLRNAQSCEPLIAQLRQEESKADAAFQPYLEWRRTNRIE
jgi:tetratricopeptide (TPR) repeat protein